MNNFFYSGYIQGNHKVKKILGIKIKTQLPPPPRFIFMPVKYHSAPLFTEN